MRDFASIRVLRLTARRRRGDLRRRAGRGRTLCLRRLRLIVLPDDGVARLVVIILPLSATCC